MVRTISESFLMRHALIVSSPLDLISYFSFADEPSAFEFQKAYAAGQEKISQNVAEFAQLDKFRVIAFQDAISN